MVFEEGGREYVKTKNISNHEQTSMKRFPVSCFLILIYLGSGCAGVKEEETFEYFDLQSGDIALRKGVGHKSDAITFSDSSSIYSHVGIIVEKDSLFRIIHITPGTENKGDEADRIKCESLSSFFSRKNAEAGAIIRLKETADYGEKAALEAIRLWEKGIYFDHSYNLEDTVSMYCTELVWHAYQTAGKDITKGERKTIKNALHFSGAYIFPSNIHENKEFKYIYTLKHHQSWENQ